MVFASRDIVAAEAFALALLKDLKLSLPFLPWVTERIFLYQNRNVLDLATMPVRIHPYIRQAIQIGLGNLPEDIVFTNVPHAVRDRIRAHLPLP
jgi:hypothetical protein